MFPAVGFFKNVICPQNDGLPCERPYCHFHHVPYPNKKKLEYGTKAGECHSQYAREIDEPNVSKVQLDLTNNKKVEIQEPSTVKNIDTSTLLNQVISAAVKKAITDNPILSQSVSMTDLMSHVDPTTIFKNAINDFSSDSYSKELNKVCKRQPKLYLPPPGTPSYNPTPISELKRKKEVSTSAKYPEYTPSPIDKHNSYTEKLVGTSDVEAEFSPAEDDEQSKNDFDILDQVLAEQSRIPHRVKALTERRQKLKKERASVTKKGLPRFGTSGMEQESNSKLNDIENKPCDDSFLPPSPVFQSAADIPSYSTNYHSSMETNLVPTSLNTGLHQQLTQTNITNPSELQDIGSERTIPSEVTPSEIGSVDKVKPHSSHSMLPQIAHLSVPLAKDCIPIVKVAPTLPLEFSAVEELLQELDGKNESESLCPISNNQLAVRSEDTIIKIETNGEIDSEIITINDGKEPSKKSRKRKYTLSDDESVTRVRKKSKNKHKSRARKRSKDYESDVSYSSGDLDSSLERHKRKKHRKHSKHRSSNRKSKKYRRKRKHRRRSKHDDSDTCSNSDSLSKKSHLPVALCDIKLEKKSNYKEPEIPILITSIKKEEDQKLLVNDSISSKSSNENSELTYTNSPMKSHSPNSDFAGQIANSSCRSDQTYKASKMSLFDVVAVSLKKENSEIPSVSLISNPIESQTTKPVLNHGESVIMKEVTSQQIKIEKMLPTQSSTEIRFKSSIVRVTENNSSRHQARYGVKSQKVCESNHTKEHNSKPSKSHCSRSTHTASLSKHGQSTPADRRSKAKLSQHRHSAGSKHTHSSTSKVKKSSHSSISKLSKSSLSSTEVRKSSHSLSDLTKSSHSSRKLSKTSHSSSSKMSHSSGSKFNKSSHSSDSKPSHHSSNKLRKSSQSSEGKDNHDASCKPSLPNKDSHSLFSIKPSGAINEASNSHLNKDSSRKNAILGNEKLSPRNESKDNSKSNIKKPVNRRSSESSIKLLPSQNFADLLSSADVACNKQKSKTKDKLENRKRSTTKIARRHSLDKLSSREMECESRGSPDLGSPMPDLSALDEIGKEDWDQLLSESHARPLQSDLLSSDDDIGVSELAETFSQENPDSTFDSDDANDPKIMQECFRLFSSYNTDRKSTQNLKPKILAKKTDASKETVDVPVRHQRSAKTGATGNLLGPKAGVTRHIRSSPAQVMLERYKKLKEEEAAVQRKLAEQRSKLERTMGKGSPQLVSSSYVSSSSLSYPSTSSGVVSSTSGVGSSTDQNGVSSTAVYCGRKRIARAPSNVAALMNSKSTLLDSRRTSTEVASPASIRKETLAVTNPKGVKRIAHIPTKNETLERPIIVSDGRSKVPQNIRQRYLNTFVEETKKFCDSIKLAHDVAIAEENVCHDRASNRIVYLNVAVNTVKKLRNQQLSQVAQELINQAHSDDFMASPPNGSRAEPVLPKRKFSHPTNPNHKTMTHFSVMASGGQKGSWSIESNKKNIVKDLDGATAGSNFYKHLKKYILSSVDLIENGFPTCDPKEKGKAIIKKRNFRKKVNPAPDKRICARCSTVYQVDVEGIPLVAQACAYHWGRPYKTRGRGGFETKYSCCQSDNSADGCSLGDVHVSDNYDPDCLRGFVRTLTKENARPDVFALDCEMCYTTEGNELTRITVINSKRETVYESLVLPDNPIIDYNTRFSGITAEDMKNVTVSLRNVQAALLTIFSSKTILMGHSLESDFLALKLMHNRVVDTSVVFPHKLGSPYKRALRNLASELLSKLIQNDIGGHDSAEDAITCIELMQWKVKEDLKLAGI